MRPAWRPPWLRRCAPNATARSRSSVQARSSVSTPNPPRRLTALAYDSVVLRVAYFGPAGPFPEEALLPQRARAGGDRTRHPSVPEVIAAVERGEADGGVVPIENMIEGSVSVTLDTLAFDSELLIQREIDLPVSLYLCAKPGVSMADVETIVSFPVALEQCRGFFARK